MLGLIKLRERQQGETKTKMNSNRCVETQIFMAWVKNHFFASQTEHHGQEEEGR